MLPQFNVELPEACIIGLLSGREERADVLAAIERHGSPARVNEVTDHDAYEKAMVAVTLANSRRAGERVFVWSSDVEFLLGLADEIWWFDQGALKAKGDPREVVDQYRHAVAARLRAGLSTEQAAIAPTLRRGDGRARLEQIDTAPVWTSGESASITVRVHFAASVADPVVGIMIRTRIGMEVYGTNTELEQLKLGPVAAGDSRTVRFEFNCGLCPGEYTITAASHDPDGVWHDWLEDAIAIRVVDTRYTAGVANLRAKVTLL